MDEALADLYEQELKQLENAEPITVEIPPLVAIALISQVQLASRHPQNSGWSLEQAKFAAKQLQSYFNPDSAVAKVLEMGWNSTFDVPIPQEEVSEIEQIFGGLAHKLIHDLNEFDPDSEWTLVNEDDDCDGEL